MSFRLVPNSVTLDDLERLNSPQSLCYFTELVAFVEVEIDIKLLVAMQQSAQLVYCVLECQWSLAVGSWAAEKTDVRKKPAS